MKDAERLPISNTCLHLLQTPQKRNAIGQIRESVMASQMSNVRLVATLFGDVLMSRNPAGIAGRLMYDRNDPTVAHLDVERAGLALANEAEGLVYKDVDSLDRRVARVESLTKDLVELRPRLHLIGWNAVHFRVATIRQDQALVAVEHA